MPRPLIGINTDYAHRPQGKRLALDLHYVRAVEEAGGAPILLPWQSGATLDETLSRLDGALLVGGDDMDPAAYGAALHAATKPIDPERQAFDLLLTRRLMERRIPTLGICFGCQLLNVALGGTLMQDVPAHSGGAWHPVSVEPGSLLARALGIGGEESLEANSYHHQAVDRPGHGLRVTARTPDGVAEAVEDPGHPFLLGVQWHPERCRERPAHARLFHALVRASLEAGSCGAQDRPGDGR